MTDDIVTRLRESNGMTTSRADDGFLSIHPDTDLLRQAADEIERLREKVQDLRMYAEQDSCEIERLRATIGGWSQDISNLEDEVEDCEGDFHALKQMFDRTREQLSLAHSILASESMGWLAGGGSNHETSHWGHLLPYIHTYWSKYGSFFRPVIDES